MCLIQDENGTSRLTLTPVSDMMKFSESSLILATTITILITIVGLFGNGLTVWTLLRSPRVRNTTAAFIISLCVSDFLFCVVVLPLYVSLFIHRDWVHGPELCTLFPLIRYWSLGVSLLSITMITINRYVMITRVGDVGVCGRINTPTWIGIMIGFCWVFSFIMQLPTLLGIWGKFGYDPLLRTCTILPDAEGRSSKRFLFIMGFIVPCLVIIFCYVQIFWTVHKSESRLRGHRAEHPKETKTRGNEWRITKMVFIIFISFVVCYFPITILKITDTCVTQPALHLMGYLLIFASACVNPIIYVFMNKQYRDAFMTVLCSTKRTGPRDSFRRDKENPIVGADHSNSQTGISRVSAATGNPRGVYVPTTQLSPGTGTSTTTPL